MEDENTLHHGWFTIVGRHLEMLFLDHICTQTQIIQYKNDLVESLVKICFDKLKFLIIK